VLVAMSGDVGEPLRPVATLAIGFVQFAAALGEFRVERRAWQIGLAE
jgi:hypothetical protein